MGKGVAKEILVAGGKALLVSRDMTKLTAAAEELKAAMAAEKIELAEDAVKVATLDVSDEAAVKAFFDAVTPGSLHHLVSTVGASSRCNDLCAEDGYVKFVKQFQLKVFAQAIAVSFGASKLADGGCIVLVSGALSRRPGKGSAALAAANAAVEALAKALANDLGPRLRVNCLSPGLTDTEMWDALPPHIKAGILEEFAKEVPAGRAGTKEDVGHAVRFLLENSWVTGSVLDVDGGAVIRT